MQALDHGPIGGIAKEREYHRRSVQILPGHAQPPHPAIAEFAFFWAERYASARVARFKLLAALVYIYLPEHAKSPAAGGWKAVEDQAMCAYSILVRPLAPACGSPAQRGCLRE
jgi:hypothetical protein